ncbi:MAG: hypothetical protein ABIP20_08710 [Chthoniobacteraceae bacterium]
MYSSEGRRHAFRNNRMPEAIHMRRFHCDTTRRIVKHHMLRALSDAKELFHMGK